MFGVRVCHRDPEVGQFGLHNALMPFGTSFVEVVAPLREGTTAGRYLERRKGDDECKSASTIAASFVREALDKERASRRPRLDL